MGVNDHKKQWEFLVRGSVQECERAFMASFDGGKFGAKGQFEFARDEDPRSGPHLAAIYRGRKGAGAFMASISRTQGKLEDAAIGSSIAFAAEPADNAGQTLCTMWLKSWGKVAGAFTADVGVLRNYMRAVEKQLATIDPKLRVVKH